MRCGEFKVSQALGLRLFNAIELGRQTLSKGHALNEGDLLTLKQAGIEKIFGAVMDDDDISDVTALGILAAKLCGENVAYTVAEDGLVQMVATIAGVVINNEERVAKFNRLSPNVILNVVEPYSSVQENEIIASLQMVTPIIEQALVDEMIFKLSGNVEMLKVAPFNYLNVGLIYTHVFDDAAETKHFTNVVKKLVKNFNGFELVFTNEYHCEHYQDSIADAIEVAIKADNEVIFILSAQPTICEQDVVPAAFNSLVEEIINLRIPQVMASDLLIAELHNKKLINLPYAYDVVDTAMINRYIKQALFSERLNKFEFDHQPTMILAAGKTLVEDETSGLIKAYNKEKKAKIANIGAVVLAAGIGSRAGRNKLMIEMADGEPMFMRAVKAAMASKASPVFVVTGYHDEEMQEYLDKVDVNVLYNPAYRSGVKTSINLGLKSIPSFCEGAVIIPADMPNIEASDIDTLIKAFKKSTDKQLLMFKNGQEKYNPILWSKDLYEKADIVPEGAELRPIFMEHADYTNYIEVKDINKFVDVNFPSDLEKIKH